MRRLTNPALIRLILNFNFREYPIRTDVTFDKSNKTQAYHLRPLGQFSLILSRLELEYHSYQKCTLPVKLKNLAVKL